MNLDSLIIKEVKEVKELKGLLGMGCELSKNHPYKLGENYLIRTVTMIDVGRLESVGEQELVLSSAAWIADTDRWSECLKTGKLKEVEPFPDGDVIIGRGSVIDAVIWTSKLPREVK